MYGEWYLSGQVLQQQPRRVPAGARVHNTAHDAATDAASDTARPVRTAGTATTTADRPAQTAADPSVRRVTVGAGRFLLTA